MKSFTLNVKTIALITYFLVISPVYSQNSGLWVASGSGATTSWSTTAGAVGITTTATNYGSGTSYTLNNFVTNDVMGCNNSAYSDPTIVGNPSLSIRHTFPNTAQITFSFSMVVENPVIHFDRLGGGQSNNLTTSSLITVITPGITFTELSENDVHFVTTATTIGRHAHQPYTALPSECGPPLAGTASGSVRLNGIFDTVTFEISMDASGSSPSINDRWEIAFSDVKSTTLDFDGVDDYINRAPFLGGKTEVTMMTWFKMDSGSDGGEIMGQRNFRLYVDANKRLKGYMRTSTNLDITSPDISEALLSDEMWYHATLKFISTTGTFELFLNGKSIYNYTNPTLVGVSINNSSSWNSDHDFEIGRNTFNDNNYFEGSIYECRVYDKALTLEQLHRQINQEIENNSGNVRGTVIPKDIEGLSWSDLILYYKMGVIETGYTPDESNSNVDGRLHNMRTYQEYTAPLPYVTTSSCSGDWDSSSNWEHGSVWDIHSTPPDCAIVQVKGDIDLDKDITTVGLIIDSGAKLDVNNNSGIFNSWYVKLDGKIDLEGESQLVQTEDSTLDPTSAGTLEKDQQGTADTYTYNYWSSPVGRSNNSTNNNDYNVTDIFTNVNFLSSGYNGSASPLSIADYWIWKFSNRLSDDYASWQHVRQSGMLQVGEGFTMKGPGSGSISDDQNYILEGKPNNGDIDLTISAGNDYLVGNPYPSAIDAQQFILDNGATIAGPGSTTGTLYFWEHWGGGSHIASQYQGGYATYSLAGGVPAAAIGTSDPDVSSGGIPTKIPGRYIPVGQGFFVTAETGGTIKFNNGQRVFQAEDGLNSLFVKGKDSKKSSKNNTSKTADQRMKLRIGFNSVNTLRRQVLLTVDKNASSGIDWGYDSKYIDTQMDDMYWMLEGEKFVIQALDTITEDTKIPLGIHTKTTGFNSFTIDKLENVPDGLEIFLHDKEAGIYHDLLQTKYETSIPAGSYLDRFEITFAKAQTLSNEELQLENKIEAFYANEKESIIIRNPKAQTIKTVEMFNILGQTLFQIQLDSNKKNIEYKVPKNIAGNYIINVETASGKTSKKIAIK